MIIFCLKKLVLFAADNWSIDNLGISVVEMQPLNNSCYPLSFERTIKQKQKMVHKNIFWLIKIFHNYSKCFKTRTKVVHKNVSQGRT